MKGNSTYAKPNVSGYAMIEIAKKAFSEHGLPSDRLFYDSFEFGLDVPVRVLARPH